MKKIFSAFTILSCLTTSFTLAPTATSTPQSLVVRFYCGQSFDPSSNKIIPTTLIATSARREPVAFIQWKSKSFGKYTPKNRCAIVSPKLQQAWEAKRLRYLTAGTSPQTGQGIICGSSTKTQCNNSNMLFTLNSGADASEVIARIREIQSGKTSGSIAQSSGDNSVDMQELVTQLGSK